MSWLLDVNLILASRWTTHSDQLAARAWIDSAGEFYTCAITELGFLRISLSVAYHATWSEAQEALDCDSQFPKQIYHDRHAPRSHQTEKAES